MAKADTATVTDVQGRQGKVRFEGDSAVVDFGDRRHRLSRDLLEPRPDGSFALALNADELETLETNPSAEEYVIPLVEEELVIGKREQQQRLRVHKQVGTRTEHIEVPLLRSEFEIERVPIGRPVDEAPEAREEDGVTIIPVMEERLVLHKQLVLKEEIHLIRRQVTETYRDEVTLREEEVSVERLPAGEEKDVAER